MKFVLLVEGNTEKQTVAEFLKRWLDPQLKARVGIQVVRFNGYSQLLQKVVVRAQGFIDGPKSEDIVSVIGLIDLYGPTFYPEHCVTAEERRAWATQRIESEVNRDRFHMFFAVHEFEAWLLAQPSIFPSAVRRILPPKTILPESVNFDEPPARLLNRLYTQATRREYKKVTHGRELFAKLDPNVAVSKCPCLAEMLNELLRLAKAAGL
ncbi:MAG: DUF4276 family protein [Pirellula sp.]